MIEKIAKTLAYKIHKNASDIVDYDEIEVIQYGIECIINITIPLAIIYFIALIYSSFVYSLLWSILFLIIRNFTGGYHASSHIKCMIYSTCIGLIVLYFIIHCSYDFFIVKILILLSTYITYLLCGSIIQNDYTQQEIKSLKKTGKLIYLLYILLSIVLLHYRIKIGNVIFVTIISNWLLYALEIILLLKKRKQNE